MSPEVAAEQPANITTSVDEDEAEEEQVGLEIWFLLLLWDFCDNGLHFISTFVLKTF